MTVRENLIPSAMVPGLVTIKDKKGNMQNVYPVDAKELINSGEYELVENGAIEAARMAATPLRSGQAAGIPSDLIVAEVAGIAGGVVTANTPEEAEKIIADGDNADAVPADDKAPKQGAAARQAKEAESAAQPKTDVEKAQDKASAAPPKRFGDKDDDKAGADKK